MIISKIQVSYIHLFLINQLVNYKKIIFLKTFNSNFSYVEIWFTDHNSKSLQIEDKINITLIKVQKIETMQYSVQFRD